MSEKRLRLWYEVKGSRIPVDIFTDSSLTIKWIQVGDASVHLEDFLKGRNVSGVHAGDPDVPGYSPLFSDAPCWFEGCAELRAAYNKEIEDEVALAKVEGRPCTSCDQGAIRRKYIAIMRQNGYPLHPLSNASYRQSSGSETET